MINNSNPLWRKSNARIRNRTVTEPGAITTGCNTRLCFQNACKLTFAIHSSVASGRYRSRFCNEFPATPTSLLLFLEHSDPDHARIVWLNVPISDLLAIQSLNRHSHVVDTLILPIS